MCAIVCKVLGNSLVIVKDVRPLESEYGSKIVKSQRKNIAPLSFLHKADLFVLITDLILTCDCPKSQWTSLNY